MADTSDSSVASQPNESWTRRAGLSTAPVPMQPDRSEQHFALERERIFGRSWLMMGRVEEIPKAGDFVRNEIEVCRASVIVTRGKAGEVRAFHNVCSHRGNLVVLESSGHANRFLCRYHNWSYGTDGRLLGVPDERSFFDLSKARCGLTAIACEVWEGWIFINLQREPEVSLLEFLGPFATFLSGIQYNAADHPLIVQADLDCNWKVVSDAFSESYHIPAIHPQTIGATFQSTQERWSQRAQSTMADIDAFYRAALDAAPAAFALLNSKTLNSLSVPQNRLLCLMLSLANCAMAVELHKSPRAPHSPYPHGVTVVKGGVPFG